MAPSDKNISNIERNRNIAADIFAKYGDFIYKVICSKTSNKAQIDDLYQDFFLSLVSNPIDPDLNNIKSYLYQAIMNDITDASRRTKRYQELINNYSNNFNFTINKSVSINANNSEGEIERVFKLVREGLSPSEAKAIALRYKDNCNNEEIAEKIGAKKESVSRYICVALKKIRQMLAAGEDK